MSNPVNRGELTVKIISLSGIIPQDSNGKSDPFCVPCLEDGERKISEKEFIKKNKRKYKSYEIKTEIVKKSLDPVFNETFVLKVDDSSRQWLHIDIWDWDRMSGNDYIGVVKCPLQFLSQGDGHAFDIGISSQGSCKLILEAKGFGRDSELHHPCQQETEGMLLKPLKGHGTLRVTIEKAVGLRIADRGLFGSSSDPYVRTYISQFNSPKKSKKTKVIKRNLNPVWNETFEFQVCAMLKQRTMFYIYDRDYHPKNPDDPLGHVKFPMFGLIRGKELYLQFQVMRSKKKQGRGSLFVKLLPLDFGFENENDMVEGKRAFKIVEEFNI